MAISQADFYAFSQATGSPVPEDPEGRAALAPYVLEWRRNQLKQPSQEEKGPNLIQTVGGLAAAAGVGTLAFLGGRRLGAAMAARRGVQPVNVTVAEDAVRRAAQPIPQLRGVTGSQPGAGTARPPIPRPPAPSTPPSAGPTRTSTPDPWSQPVETVLRTPSQAESAPGPRALPPAEPEYVAYRPDPQDFVSAEVQEARRKAATANLIEASRRIGEYQPELPGVKGTLMALRSPAGALAEETGELVAQAESRPLSAAPAQLNLLNYVREAAEPQGDAVDRLLTEYNQLVESQARADRRAQASVRQYQMEVQGKAMRVLDQIRKETPQLTVGERLAKVGAGMSGVPVEWEGGTGIGLKLDALGFQDVELSSPAAQSALSKAGVTEQEAVEYWTQKLNTMVDNQQAKSTFNVDQAINALDSGEDQMTGRVRQQLQRNEDLNLSSIDQAEDLTNNIDVAASMTPDGVPMDQAEGIDLRTGERFAIKQNLREEYPRSTLGSTGLVPGQRIQMEEEVPSAAGSSAARFMEAEREKIAREMAGRDLAAMPYDVDVELARRLGKGASSYGPKYSARRQALELFAKTGDPKTAETIKRFGLSPVTFETFENMPAEKRRLFETRPPMSLEGYPSEELIADIPRSGIEVNVPGAGRVDISTLRKPVVTEDTALAAEEYVQGRLDKDRDWLESIKAEVQPQLNEIFSERRALIENKAAQLKPLLNQAQATGNVGKAREIESQLNALRYQFRNPQSHPHRRDEANVLEARIGGAQRKIQANAAGYERKYPTTLSDWSGGTDRVFGELNVETGEFIPETMELRSDRRALEIQNKGGGGRNVGEYTAGERLDEEIRAIQGGGRVRDYDPETGAVAQRWEGDRTQTGRSLDIYGVRLSGQRADDPEVRPSVPQYTQDEIEAEALRLSEADPYGDVPMAPPYADVVESLGSQPKTPAGRRSIDVATQLRRLQTSGRPGEAQAFLDKMMKQRGISGASGTYSRL